MEHIVLVGDATFDNSNYVITGPDVISHLRQLLPSEWRATLCAIDGSTTAMIPSQAKRVPNEASYIVASFGGNDALKYRLLLSNTTQSSTHILSALAKFTSEFMQDYRNAIISLKELKKPLCLCTIYNGNLKKEEVAPAKVAIAVYNDSIYSVANELRVPVLELRRICTEPADYINEIEPSELGGRKIANAILAQVKNYAVDEEHQKKAL